MQQILYQIITAVYELSIRIAALWNAKARLWVEGRQEWQGKLRAAISQGKNARTIWMHCASLGEFEQGRPLLEALKSEHPDSFIVLSFFSPSGYEVRKNYSGADVVCYLPMDGARNARQFLELVQPVLVLFVKYEFWHFYLKALHDRHIPTVLVSGAFRQSQPFFRWWGGFFRKILGRFTLLTVQDRQSLTLLQGIGLESHLTGDTRYDRVAQIASEAKTLPLIEDFRGESRLIIAGSTWPDDERLLSACLGELPEGWKLVIAPHEIDAPHIESIKNLFGDACILYSGYQSNSMAKVLIIDNIGMLSSLYRYGEVACIGGGFNRSGIHNVLEPAVFGLPVVMGPEYEKFGEAVQMVRRGFAFPAADQQAYCRILKDFIHDQKGLIAMQGLIRAYIKEHTGATAKILSLLPIGQ